MRITNWTGFIDVRSWNHGMVAFARFQDRLILFKRVRVTAFGVEVNICLLLFIYCLQSCSTCANASQKTSLLNVYKVARYWAVDDA